MALDGIFLNSLINNLKDVLIDSKIDKINQPEKDEVILTIRKDRKNYIYYKLEMVREQQQQQ